MNPSIIEIHEFSTGIRPQQIANGGWVSLGFTGQYMNVTIERIPEVVERSIANREFAVAEGASSDQPAIIGRVLGTGEDTWSVVAVVTRGRDEKGRSASMYRYFLTQGSEGYQNLRLILAWWESQEIPLTFNPFDLREMGKPNLCNVDETSTQFRKPSSEAIAIPVNTPEPILLTPQQQYDLQALNTLAFKKYNANKNGQAISWAFNVEALEKPERFLVIQAASDRAYQILQKAITSTPKVLAPVLTDEEALKSAIRGLMNSSQVKLENIKVIADALSNDKITSEYWHTLFDGQGATAAISQKIYSPQMVRLVTLRAVVIPETMLEFLGWLNIKPGQKQKPDEHQTVSLEFQKAIRSALPKDKLANSIKFILPELLNESPKITPEAISWLLRSNDSVWASSCKDFINDVLYDLQLVVDSLKGKNANQSNLYKCDPQTWARLESCKRLVYSSHASHKLEEYAAFAKLFENLEDYPLSAYFYQVSQGIVPKKIFEEISSGHNNYSLNVLGLELQREITLIEGITYFLLQEIIVPIQIVIPLSILFFISGLFVGSTFLPQKYFESKEPKHHEFREGKPQGEKTGDSKLPDPNIPQNLTVIATNDTNFSKTKQAIEQIRSELSQELQVDKNKILNEIKRILRLENSNYTNIDKSNQEKEKWAKAIFLYQRDNLGDEKAIGYIGPETEELIKEKVKSNLL